MPSRITIRQSLVRNLVVGVLVLGGAIIATTFFGSRSAVRRLSERMITQAIDSIEGRLDQFFAPVRNSLDVARGWGADGLLDLDEPDALNARLQDLMEQVPIVTSAMVADGTGREHMLLRIGDEWRCRRTDPTEWGSRSLVITWTGDGRDRSERWDDLGYDPRTRPWFEGAVDRRTLIAERGGDPMHWTPAYTFFTTKELGITASVTYGADDEVDRVIGFDVLLADITDFTRSLTVTGNGKVFVIANNGGVIGLPNDPRFDDPVAREEAWLELPENLGIPEVTAGAELFYAMPPNEQYKPFRYEAADAAWWGGTRRFEIGPDRMAWIGVVTPEKDLLSGIQQIRIAIIILTTVLLTIGIWRVWRLALRYSTPIEKLVTDSDRISRGDLEPPAPIETRVEEVSRLAEAHDRMRLGLRTLLKLERDLQLAREIQQGTFPRIMPEITGFDIHAWNAPADETGGDTYDVIGYELSQGNGRRRIVNDGRPADRALLILADATGHGIGPALSATQFRAMARMAVRAGVPLETLSADLNAQLCHDLPESHFITAWLGEVDIASGTMRVFSAGQGPLLHYESATETCRVLSANAPPFGIVSDLGIEIGEPLELAPGDVYAVFSDGIFEAVSPTGEMFGHQRVARLIETHHERSAQEIVSILRDAVLEFTGHGPAGDDRTAVVVRRV